MSSKVSESHPDELGVDSQESKTHTNINESSGSSDYEQSATGAAVAARVLRKIDWFFMPAMVFGKLPNLFV